eukprot:COSAG06_NODE_544_length_14458_cov_18.391671_10_plen_141_part_00
MLRVVHRASLLVVRPEGEARLAVKPQTVLVDGLVVRARDDSEINRDTSGVGVIREGVMVARIAPLHSIRNRGLQVCTHQYTGGVKAPPSKHTAQRSTAQHSAARLRPCNVSNGTHKEDALPCRWVVALALKWVKIAFARA